MLRWFAKRLNDAQRGEQGFTLIELLIVIIIIGILAAIAIPFYLSQQRKAEIATCTSDARNAAAAANLYRAGPGNGSYFGLTDDTTAPYAANSLQAQGFRSSDTGTTQYELSFTGTPGQPTNADLVLNVSCNGTGAATFDASVGRVVAPTT